MLFRSGIKIRFLRLTIIRLPYGQIPCISGFRVFGKGEGTAPMQAQDVKADFRGELDMNVSWTAKDVVGCNILWGYAPEKLYHSYMVFGKDDQTIGALVKDDPVYVRVDVFNEYGITEGEVQRVR